MSDTVTPDVEIDITSPEWIAQFALLHNVHNVDSDGIAYLSEAHFEEAAREITRSLRDEGYSLESTTAPTGWDWVEANKWQLGFHALSAVLLGSFIAQIASGN